jgi:CopG family transcriptional regulator, nickel-responsive regulator
MSELMRLSFSLEAPLLEKLEKLVQSHAYLNRSEFIRDLIRAKLVDDEWQHDHEALGTITLIYNHHSRQLSDHLTDTQHHFHDYVLAATHVHLDHDLCAEMIMVKGPPAKIRQLADLLQQPKGVLHATLAMASTGHSLG